MLLDRSVLGEELLVFFLNFPMALQLLINVEIATYLPKAAGKCFYVKVIGKLLGTAKRVLESRLEMPKCIG
jgi:hypothetical protein